MTELARTPAGRGTVTAFDEHVGLGTVTGPDGVEFLFHCIEIADGSRTIAVGTEVGFATMTKFGRVEAADLTP